MKRYWPTMLMALVLAGLGGYLYFVEFPSEQARVQADEEEKQLLPFEEREITGLTIRTETEHIVLSPGTDHSWRITAPMQAPADSREVRALLRSLVLGKVSRVVEEHATALDPFGLDNPALVLTVQAGSRQETLSLGDAGPISSTLYAMRDSDRNVLLTDLSTSAFFNKTLHTFRKKEVLDFDRSETDRLRLTYPKTEIVLDRIRDHGKRPWQISFPVEAKADQIAVNLMLFQLEDLKALGFIDPGPERNTLAKQLGKPKVKITVHEDGAAQTVKLFHPDPSSGEAYAVTSKTDPIYRIIPSAIQQLTKDLFALRDKRLLGVDQEDIAILEVKTREHEYTLINQNEVWILEDQPHETLDQQAVTLLISRVAGLPAELRVVKRAGPLAPYGLTAPSAEFKATGKDGTVRGRLVLGKRTGGLVYAIGPGLSGIYQARADILSQIPSKGELLTKGSDQEAPTP